MKLQNIRFPSDEACEELYIRAFHMSDRQYEPFLVPQGGMICTDTYMNAFDVGAWKTYSTVSELTLCLKLKGSGTIKGFWEREKEDPVCIFREYINKDSASSCERKIPIPGFEKMKNGILYIKFWAETDSVMEAWFETDSMAKKPIRLSLVICTYKRPKELERIISVISGESRANNSGSQTQETEAVAKWLHTIIVDNASEITDTYGDGISVYHNPNTGGSGGFSRGIRETVRNLQRFEATHVIFMDDDAVLQMESIYRLRALLSFVKPQYEEETVAGRMFRMDQPWVQYTASEIWNGGEIRHIGWNQDMTDRQHIWNMNENVGGEYSGWWFACFPIEFVKNNSPLPFFLHCDDVEYGLRHGGTPLILNGIQVWHDIYEYRQSPVIAYYDYRNSLIVNALYGRGERDKDQLWKQFKQKIGNAHGCQNYLLEYFLIRAFRDYLKGMKWFMEKDDTAVHTALKKKKRAWRYANAIRWRIAFLEQKGEKGND
ncbi:MAG: glycosyltransferase [Acetatifactor sp.]|nr:glycosyltransferase [Acetatifactor sp.]